MRISWFSAGDTGSTPITMSDRSTGYPDIDSLANAILDKIGSPGA